MVCWAAEGQQQGRPRYDALVGCPPSVCPTPQIWQHQGPPQDACYCQSIPQLQQDSKHNQQAMSLSPQDSGPSMWVSFRTDYRVAGFNFRVQALCADGEQKRIDMLPSVRRMRRRQGHTFWANPTTFPTQLQVIDID